mmetsp:Transcript_15435/g.45126  ORF Transcript_15435/g.45126 Transcript_15435/m.45126 type:complete len:303 (+) Transcript_15435:335-1243(+)
MLARRASVPATRSRCAATCAKSRGLTSNSAPHDAIDETKSFRRSCCTLRQSTCVCAIPEDTRPSEGGAGRVGLRDSGVTLGLGVILARSRGPALCPLEAGRRGGERRRAGRARARRPLRLRVHREGHVRVVLARAHAFNNVGEAQVPRRPRSEGARPEPAAATAVRRISEFVIPRRVGACARAPWLLRAKARGLGDERMARGSYHGLVDHRGGVVARPGQGPLLGLVDVPRQGDRRAATHVHRGARGRHGLGVVGPGSRVATAGLWEARAHRELWRRRGGRRIDEARVGSGRAVAQFLPWQR